MTLHRSNQAWHDVARIFDFNAAFYERCAVTIDGRLIGAAMPIERNPVIGHPIGCTSVRQRLLADIQYVVRYASTTNV